MTINDILPIASTIGGFEFIKWLFNRKSNSRIQAAEATIKELDVVRQTMQFLQEQLKNKEERFVQQTERLRSIQDLLHTEKEKHTETRIELAVKRCNVAKCPQRLPPTGY
ncbi:MAG: hypothetical protein R3Y22_07865 [Bacteroidales bacterium]